MPTALAALFSLAALLIAACAAGPADQPHPLAGVPIALPAAPAPGEVDLPRLPAISPDGSLITFAWRGDLWKVGAQGGPATRLTAHPMADDLSVWSPDGTRIAFNSMRSGYRNIHLMNADGSGVTQVTHEDESLWVSGWHTDGTLALSSYLEADVHKNPRPFSVATTGGPITRLHDAFGRQPVISPDGRYVAFVRGRGPWDRPFLSNSDNRDLWLYDRQQQTFRRLTKNPGNDGKPRWKDNRTIIYQSARPPTRINLYAIDIAQGEDQARALTAFTDNDVLHFDIARDGTTAVLHVWDKLYTLDLNDPAAQPVPLTITAPTDADDLMLVQELPGNANEAAVSPDGRVMAVSIRGELFVRTIDSQDPPQRITRSVARDDELAWSPDGRYLYFVSDSDGTRSIYRASVSLTRTHIREAIEESIKSEEPENQALPNPEANQEEPDEAAAVPAVDNQEKPDNAANPDQSDANKKDPTLPDPSDWHDAVRFTVEPVVQSPSQDSDPSPSPDGQTLAFRRGNGDIVLLDLATGQERLFLASWDSGTHWAWSADSRHLAVSYEDQDHNADIWVGPADASAPLVNITKHPDADVLPSFSHDGKILTFVSARNEDQYDVYAIYLDKDLETYTPQQLADYYKQAAEKAKKLKPLATEQAKSEGPAKEGAADTGEDEPEDAGPDDEAADERQEEEEEEEEEIQAAPEPLDLDDAYLRLRRLTSTGDREWSARVLPGGDKVAFTRGVSAYVIGWDGKDEKKLADNVTPQQLTLTGGYVVALRNGNPLTIAVDNNKTTDVAFPGSIRVDRVALQRQRFDECARAITTRFYDGAFKGIDWAGATAKYGQLASRTWTADEFDDIANRYLGLLDASHMGIRSPSPSAENSQPSGRLGARYARVPDGYRVVEIEPKTPAAEGVMRLQPGDIITAIDFEPIADNDTVTARLAGKVGRETAVTVLRQSAGDADAEPAELVLLITPISSGAYDNIRYDNWQLANQAAVDAMSGGRLGYIHIRSMNESSLAEFERDLYAACEGRDGLIVDVRDNGGGWTTDRLLASIMTRRHAYTVPRGADPARTNSYPNDRLFITRYNLPMNALCNENSFSNAEIFSHAFKTLGRGTLVGNTSAGGVISTGGDRLLDGTTVRIPFRGWYLPDGTDMENHGAVPDLLIPQTPEAEAAGQDIQLEAAVADLMERLP